MTLPLFVQQVAAVLTTSPVPITKQTTVGNYLFAIISVSDPSGPSLVSGITDTKSNTWVVDQQSAAAHFYGSTVIAHTKLTTALGTSDTVTPAFTAPGAQWAVQILEFTGSYFTATPFDKTAENTLANATSISTNTTGTLTQASELAIAGASHGGTLSPCTWTPPSGWIEVPIGLTNNVQDVAYKQVAATTALNPNFTQTISENMGASIATYKLA